MDIKKLVEELNHLMETDIPEDVMHDEIEPEVTPEFVDKPEITKPEFNDTMSLADTYDEKAKIARALENLQSAVEEFKDATAEKVDLIKDNLLLQEIEGLDVAVNGIKNALVTSDLVPETSLNDPFKAEEPAEDVQTEPEKPVEDGVENTEDENTEETEDDDLEEPDFDAEAGLNLLGNE